MTSNKMTELLGTQKIVPVVVLDDAKTAIPTANALAAGGIKVAEVTFRTAAAPESIRLMASECPDVLVGAGTVINPKQAETAIECGAKFLVSPGFSAKVAQVAAEREITYLPGAVNPTQIMECLEYGIDTIKFFPAEAMGGLGTVKALAGPFPQVSFVPTGGIGPDNLEKWLSHPAIVAVGGSWMVGRKLVNAGEYDQITTLSAAAVTLSENIAR